jgi:hypothetical protein
MTFLAFHLIGFISAFSYPFCRDVVTERVHAQMFVLFWRGLDHIQLRGLFLASAIAKAFAVGNNRSIGL